MTKTNVAELIKDAIRKEVAARKFYLKAKLLARDPAARSLLDRLAKDEARHAALLRGDNVATFLASAPPPIQDLRIAEFLQPRRISPEASFQEVLIVAMKREDASFWAYQALAEVAQDEATRKLFRRLAQEERLHRNKLEQLYDDVVFVEN